MDALVGLALPLLKEQHHIFILCREVVIVHDAAVLIADGSQDPLFHDLTEELLTTALFGDIFHINSQHILTLLFF